MKTYLWTGVTAVSILPYMSAYAATITISCGSSSGADYFATTTCDSADKTTTFYAYHGGKITCRSGGALIDYTCNVVDSEWASWTQGSYYYCGSGTFNGGTGCFSCAEYTGVPGATSATRVTGGIESCYVPIGQVVTDDDGATFDFTSACYYDGTFSPPDTSEKGVSSSSTD